MLTKIKNYAEANFSIMGFSKVMAAFIMFIACFNVLTAHAADFSVDGLKTSLIQIMLGLVASSATLIAGYFSTVVKTAVDYASDWMRAHIANTILNEFIEDLHTFVDNEADRLKPLFEAALKNDGKLDKAELNEMIDLVYKDALSVWGESKLEYIGKFRPKAVEWVKAKLESIIRGLFDRFRGTKIIADSAVPISTTATK